MIITSLGTGGTFHASGFDPGTGEVLARGVVALLGASMVGMAFMIYRGWPWVRHLLMGLVVLIVVSPIFRRDEPETPSLIFLAIAMFVIFVAFLYFYRSPKMIRHFTASSRKEIR